MGSMRLPVTTLRLIGIPRLGQGLGIRKKLMGGGGVRIWKLLAWMGLVPFLYYLDLGFVVTILNFYFVLCVFEKCKNIVEKYSF